MTYDELKKAYEEATKKCSELEKENSELKSRLSVMETDGGVIVNVDPSLEGRIKTEIIDAQKFVLIPVTDGDQIIINGHEKDI